MLIRNSLSYFFKDAMEEEPVISEFSELKKIRTLIENMRNEKKCDGIF